MSNPDLEYAPGSIVKVRAWFARLPLKTPLVHATTDVAHLESVLVEVQLDSGETGRAEVRGNGGYATGEDTDRIVRALTTAIRERGGERTAAADLVVELSYESTLAAMAVDVAAWDAVARQFRVPLHRLWMPAASGVASVRTHASVGFAESAEVAARRVASGFDRLKVRVGASSADADLDRVRGISVAAGLNVGLIVDANGGYSVEQALALESGLRSLPVVWFEQPVATMEELTELRGRTKVPIYADEVARDAESIRQLVGVVSGVHLKLEKAGSVTRLFRAVAAARQAGLSVALGQMDQGRLGCAVTTQLAVALQFHRAELWGYANVQRDLTEQLRLQNGSILVPSGPGTGITVIDSTLLEEVV